MNITSSNTSKAFLCVAIFASAFLATTSSEAGTLKHIRGKVMLLNDQGNFALAREQSLDNNAQVLMPADSQMQIAWDEDSFLEVKGPARFRLQDNRLVVEFGRYLFFSRDSYPLRVRVFDEVFRPSSEAALELDIPITRSQAQFLLFAGSQSFLGFDLEPERLYLFENSKLQQGSLAPDFAKQRRSEFTFTTIHMNDLKEEEVHISYRNQIIISLQANLNRLAPASPSASFTQNTFGFGSLVEWNHKRYFNLPNHAKRIHYLGAPALRLGVGANFSSGQIKPTDAIAQNSQFLGAHFAAGTSWLGLSVEGVLNYLTENNDFVKTDTPYGYGIRVRHEWDLLEVTQSDILISLGYSYMSHSLKTADSVSPQPSTNPFKLVRHGIDLSFHLNF